MKLLIDILHPVHVHIFKNFIRTMKERGHEIIVTAREKDVTIALLRAYHIPYTLISRQQKGALSLGKEFLTRTWKLYHVVRKEKPDLLLGCMGPSIAVVGKLTGVPTYVFYDNESALVVNSFVQRIATKYITSSSYEKKIPGNHITYSGYQNLAYLHPKYFQPDKRVLEKAGISPTEPFFIVRLVSFESSHDLGVTGLSDQLGLCQRLEKYGRVIITSEKPLPAKFDKYRLALPAEDLHHLLAFAKICIGESATLAAEAALLGVPAIYVASSFRGYTNELERDYGLVYNFKDQQEAEKKIFELLQKKNLRKEWQKKREKLLSEKIDVTEWMVRLVENEITKTSSDVF